jgi:hypothetical protein
MNPIFVSRRYVCFVLCSLLLCLAQNAPARVYRWENEQGEVVYSDRVPPEEAKQKRETLNKAGRVTEVSEGPKSKEQWELEKRLDALRKEQEKIIAKQKSDDKVLTSTFRSVDDMRRMLDGKLAAIDAQQKVAEGNLLRLDQQLQTQQKNAAKFEREGRAVPEFLLQDIASSEQQINRVRAEIEHQIQNKEQVRKAFEADIARFKFLTQSDVAAETISDAAAELKAENELGLVSCERAEQCIKAWQLARAFVQKYSSTPIHVDNDQLILGSDPRTDRDLSLSVSKMARAGHKTQIFLDIRCYKSSLGDELCAGPKVRDIRMGFRPFIEAGLAAQQ